MISICTILESLTFPDSPLVSIGHVFLLNLGQARRGVTGDRDDIFVKSFRSMLENERNPHILYEEAPWSQADDDPIDFF